MKIKDSLDIPLIIRTDSDFGLDPRGEGGPRIRAAQKGYARYCPDQIYVFWIALIALKIRAIARLVATP